MDFGLTMWTNRLAKFFQWIWWIAGSVVITIVLLLAVILNVARLSTPWLNHHPEFLQKQISEVLPYKLDYQSIDLSWSWLSPKIILSDINLSKPSYSNKSVPEVLHIDQVSLSLNLLQTALDAHVHLNALRVEGAHMIIREQADGYLVNGFFIPKNKSGKPVTIHSILSSFSMLKISEIKLNNLQLSLYLMQHDPIDIQLQSVMIEYENNDYRLHGLLSVSPDHIDSLKFWFSDNDLTGIGKACLQFSHMHLEHLNQWSFLLPVFSKLNASWESVLELDTYVDATIWLDLNQNQMTKVQALLQLNQIHLDNQELNQEPTVMNSLSANIAMVHLKSQWTVSADQIEGVKNNLTYPLGDFLIHYSCGNDEKPAWTIYANHLNVAIFSQPLWIHFLSGFPKLKEWSALNPHGFIDFMHLNLTQDKSDDLSAAHFEIQVFLNQLSWQAVGHVPSVSHLNGAIEGDNTSGTVRFNQSLGELNFQGLFKYPFIMKKSSLDGDWTYDAKQSAWKFNVNSLALSDGHLNLQVQGSVYGQGLQAPVADLQGDVSLNNLSALDRYLPLIKLSPKLYDWLVNSLQAGDLVNGKVALKGPLKFFPFKKNEGTFVAYGDFEKIHFKFDPAWPALTDLHGHLVFQNNSLQVDQASAQMFGMPIQHIQSALPSFSQADVDVTCDVSGNLKNLGDFFLSTPLSVAKVFKNLTGEGIFNGSLHVNLPIKNMKDEVKVDGFVTMQNATWQAPAWSMLMTDTHGTLQFTQLGATAHDIEGTLFGSPTQVMITSEIEPGLASPAVGVQLTGDYSFPLLVKTYIPMLEPFVAGHSPIVMDLTVYGADAHKDNVLQMYSDLVGTQVLQFPDGLSKQSDEKRDLHVMMQLGEKKTLINADYDHAIKSQTVLEMNDNKQSVLSSHITMGDVTIPDDQNEGMAIAMDEPQSDLDTWYRLYDTYILHPSALSKNSMILYYFSAKIGMGNMFNQDLKDIHFMIKKSGDEWDWRIASSRVNGDGNLPIKAQDIPWVFHLRNANLTSIKIPQLASSDHAIKYSDIPSMKVSIENFSYEKYQLHQLSYELSHPNPNQLGIHHISIGDDILNLTGQLDGMNLDGVHPFWQFDGSVQGSDFGTGLAELGLPVHLVNTSGAMQISSRIDNVWPVGHWQDIVNKISATVQMSLENGTVIGLSPSLQGTLGSLKILNSLSISSLPEKLSGQGAQGNLFFTKIEGTASLKNAQWQVPGITLSSSELSATGSGYGQLSDKSLDFWVKVNPHLTGSLPVIAAFAGGPVVGIASWLVDKIFVNPVLSNAAAKSFHMKGKWPNIQVNALNTNGS
jgi:uncharacterized protein (TIGR02099 family)